MKQLLFFFAAAVITLGAVCVIQSQKIAGQRTQLAALADIIQQDLKHLESLETSEKRAQKQADELLRHNQDLTAQIQTRQQTEAQPVATPPTNPPTQAATSDAADPASETAKPNDGKNGFGNFLSKMMQDPQAKKFIRDQQRMMMDQLYAPLVKQMALTPEESERFKDLLADNMMKGAEKASSLFGGASSSNRAETLTALSADQKSFDDEVKTFLGDERYALYKDYQQTVGERTQLNQFKQMAGTESPLTDQQTEQLLAIMKEEKQAVTAATGQSFPGQDQANFQTMLSEPQVEKLLQSQEAVNERVFQRAGQVLAPDQLSSFARFQTNQLQMMRMGMTMARKFLVPNDSANERDH